MKISARNTLAGSISKVTKGAVNAEVELTLEGGDKVVAIITNDGVASSWAEGRNAWHTPS